MSGWQKYGCVRALNNPVTIIKPSSWEEHYILTYLKREIRWESNILKGIQRC